MARSRTSPVADTYFATLIDRVKSEYDGTVDALAAEFGIERASLYTWLNGSVPGKKHFPKLAALSGVPIEEIEQAYAAEKMGARGIAIESAPAAPSMPQLSAEQRKVLALMQEGRNVEAAHYLLSMAVSAPAQSPPHQKLEAEPILNDKIEQQKPMKAASLDESEAKLKRKRGQK